VATVGAQLRWQVIDIVWDLQAEIFPSEATAAMLRPQLYDVHFPTFLTSSQTDGLLYVNLQDLEVRQPQNS